MCDLSDAHIIEAYQAILQEDNTTNWLLLGYHDTRDVISLYNAGSGGLEEFRNQLTDEVLYGFLKIEDKYVLLTWVSEHVSGVRRARALVHSRSVAALLKNHDVQFTASNLNDLSETSMRSRLKLGEPLKPATRQNTSPPSPPRASIEDDFVEASENLTEDKIEIDDATLAQRQEEERERREREAAAQHEAALKKTEEERLAALKKQEKEQQAEAERQRLIEEKERLRIAAEQEEEKKRLLAEQEKARQIQEQKLKKQEEERRLLEEKKRLQHKLLEAEKNKDILLSGFLSVQPQGSPFWRRRYFTIKGKAMALYRDELSRTPIQVLDLTGVTRLSNVDTDQDTFVPNSFVLETKLNGAYQLFADNKKGLETILAALQTAI
ncbi:hypothetical protein BY458DRAFT_529633 [Sporodiniella umbellata]|nr:hypothetical protein BY458DRAFT_529633 [Sporodiniella umbellata]